MSNLIPFNYNGTQGVRLIEKDGQPWFILRDVCGALEIENYRNVAARLDDDEKDVHQTDTPGGIQSMIIVNESGLYNVILRSDKPEAKQFKRWITHEVLPSIRKTGMYSVSNLSKELQAILFIDNKMQHIESRVDKLENTMTIDYSQQEELRTAANKKVLFTLGGKDTMAYKRVGRKAFAGLYRDIKQAFSVNSYKNIAVVDMDKAKLYIANWQPDEELGLMIDGANARAKELLPV